MEDSRLFVDVMDNMISNIRAKYDTVNNKEPYFLYGHYKAIANELLEIADSEKEDEKYPLFILGFDPDYREKEIDNDTYEVSFNLWLVYETKKAWFTSERFDHVFKTILFPLYELFLEELTDSIYTDIVGIQDVQPELTLHPYWGTENSQGAVRSVINDPTDAIRIKINRLVINRITENC